MCGGGDAVATGTSADAGTTPEREDAIKITTRPRRPYHAFVSHPLARAIDTLKRLMRLRREAFGNPTIRSLFLSYPRNTSRTIPFAWV